MMTLGGVTFDRDLQWEDEFRATYGVGTAERALDGTLIVQHRAISKIGRNITLVGSESSGWLSRSTVETLLALADSLDTDYVLGLGTIGGQNYRSFRVRFRHEEGPVIDMTPVTLVPDEPDSGFWYYGTIKLRTVA